MPKNQTIVSLSNILLSKKKVCYINLPGVAIFILTDILLTQIVILYPEVSE